MEAARAMGPALTHLQLLLIKEYFSPPAPSKLCCLSTTSYRYSGSQTVQTILDPEAGVIAVSRREGLLTAQLANQFQISAVVTYLPVGLCIADDGVRGG